MTTLLTPPIVFRSQLLMLKSLSLFLALMAMIPAYPVAAADFQRGLDAYHNGLYTTAKEEWLPLAEQGDARAQLNLGLMFYDAKAGAQNFKDAAKWLSRAAEQGKATVEAYYALALMYSNGWGVRQDYVAAVKWYLLAAEQGSAEAQYNLALMYGNGLGAQQDNTAAVKWLLRAAEQGHTGAQYNLGTMYVNGEGVDQDYVQACMWFNISAANGNREATHACEPLAGKMTPAQLDKAQESALEWVKNHKS